jgi:ABC-type nitrate/sulfonate/bicarbonate transport system substrate-binding protein
MKHPKIIIATGMHQIHHKWPAMIAKEQHFFSNEGLTDTTIITTNHNDDNLGKALSAGTVHFGLDAKPQDVIRWVTKQGADIFIIGCYKNQFHMAVMGAKGLKSIRDLKGKRIGVSTGKADTRVSLDAAQARIMLKSVGLDPDKDVTWVTGPRFHHVQGDPMDALAKSEADCVFVTDLDATNFQAEGYPVLLRFKEFYEGGYPDRNLITTGALIEKYPATVTAFIKAMIRALRFLRDMPKNHDYMVDLDKRLRVVESDPKERDAKIDLSVEKLASSPHPLDCRLQVKGFQTIIDQLKEEGLIPQSFNSDQVVKLQFVEQANRELDTRPELQDELKRVKQWIAKFGY